MSSSSGRAGGVSFAADAMLAAVFRVALKAFGERARFLTLPGPGFRQVHLDADFLRQVRCDVVWVPAVSYDFARHDEAGGMAVWAYAQSDGHIRSRSRMD